MLWCQMCNNYNYPKSQRGTLGHPNALRDRAHSPVHTEATLEGKGSQGAHARATAAKTSNGPAASLTKSVFCFVLLCFETGFP